MLRKSFTFILLTLLTFTVTFAQDKKESKKDKDQDALAKQAVLSSALGRALLFSGRGSYLGVFTTEVNKENFAKFGLSSVKGVAVNKIAKDSPAAKAGLQEGDVITRFNGEAVTSKRKLTRLIREVAPDHEASLTVLRKGSERKIDVTIGQRKSRFSNGSFVFPRVPRMPRAPRVKVFPRGKGKNYTYSFSSNRSIGVGVSSLTKQLGEHFGVPNGDGILVNRVYKDSPAAKAGLKAGDVIVEADGKKMENSFDLIRAINDKKEGAVKLTVVRNKNRRTISVTPEKRKANNRLFRIYNEQNNSFTYDPENYEHLFESMENLRIPESIYRVLPPPVAL